jgi:hypothetical protein
LASPPTSRTALERADRGFGLLITAGATDWYRAFGDQISASTGVNGVVLSSLTSILINIPLMRSITKEAAFCRRVNFALVTVAITGLIGAGLNLLVFDLIPKVLVKA